MSTRTLSYSSLDMHTPKGRMASGVDRDAFAFLTAAQIYNTNQIRAIVNLVTSLKRVGLWSKLRAIYPFVGGTADSHKWNLKDPRDLDAAFRLQFFGGWTHSATGAKPNGSNAYANTFIVPANVFALGSASGGAYSRENNSVDSRNEYGCGIAAGNSPHFAMRSRLAGFFFVDTWSNGTAGRIQVANENTLGFSSVSRTAANVYKAFRQGVQFGTTNTNTETQTNLNQLTMNLTIGVFNAPTTGGLQSWAVNEQAFTFFGDGLTDAEMLNLYTIVQAYQAQLGRAIEPDAQLFINAAGITDATQQAAVTDLVIQLKNYGLWSKLRAIYPFVGGTAAAHTYNLKDPRNLDAAFRLQFFGGWTHSTTGALPNGTNAYANTFWATSNGSLSSGSLSFYSRTNRTNPTAIEIEMGALKSSPNSYTDLKAGMDIGTGTDVAGGRWCNNGGGTNVALGANTLGFYQVSRTSTTANQVRKNDELLVTDTDTIGATTTAPIFIGAINNMGTGTTNVPAFYSQRQLSYASIGDGLTTEECNRHNDIVLRFQQTLGRNV